MTSCEIFIAWLSLSLVPYALILAAAFWKMRSTLRRNDCISENMPEVEVLIPVKGTCTDQLNILKAVLDQDYPNYRVLFIVESLSDTANAVLDQLMAEFSNAVKIVGGVSSRCAQKNHNLLAGLSHLKPETEIILFCDSTNVPDRQWLRKFTEPIRSGAATAVTTFRDFKPIPETIAGISQAAYASFVLLLVTSNPKPWGGATGIRRKVFDELNVADAWSKTVVDDLVLGNILQSAGIRVEIDPRNRLSSPLFGQSISGFVNYLDRQILFPKFTNPIIWLTTLVIHLNSTVAISVTAAVAIFACLGVVKPVFGVASGLFLATMVLMAMILRKLNPFNISPGKWMLSFLPFVFLAAFVLIRSIFRNHIDWHGRRYRPGPNGVVLSAEYLPAEPAQRS